MINSSILNDLLPLEINELFFIVKNLRLGKEHLIKKIGEKEFNNIICNIQLSPIRLSKIDLDLITRIGYFIFFFNIVFTTLLGLSFGFSGLFGSGNIKVPLLQIIFLISILTGIIITYLNGKHIYKKNDETLLNQKLLNLEIKIIQIILNKITYQIKNDQRKFNDIAKTTYEKIYSQKTHYQTNFYFKNLAYLRSYRTESPLKIKTWFLNNWGDIISASFVTLFGGFSSVFILYNNIPQSIRYSGYHFEWEEVIHSKYFLVLIAIIIAIYFTFSHTRFMYKNYIKEHSLKSLKNKICALEMKYLYLKNSHGCLLENIAKSYPIKETIARELITSEEYL